MAGLYHRAGREAALYIGYFEPEDEVDAARAYDAVARETLGVEFKLTKELEGEMKIFQVSYSLIATGNGTHRRRGQAR